MIAVHQKTLILVTLGSVLGCMSSGNGSVEGMRLWGPSPKADSQGSAYSHYLAAIIYEEIGDETRALEEMKRVPDLDPEAVTPTLRLIRAHLKKRDYESALVMAERAVKQTPDRANLWIVLGEIYHQLKRFDDAMSAFSKAIEINPDNVLGYGALVELQESTNDLVAAVDIYHRLIELSPNSAGLHYQLGLNLLRIRDAEGAQRAFTRAVELNPNLARARYLLGMIHMEAGRNEEAVAELATYLKSRPNDGQAAENLAGAAARLGRFDDTIRLLSKIIAGGESSPGHHLLLMHVQLLKGDPKMAENHVPAEGAPIFGAFYTALARQGQNLPHRPLLESLDAIEGSIYDECDKFLGPFFYLFGNDATGVWFLDRLSGFEKEGIESRVLGVLRGRIYMLLERYEEAAATFTALLDRYGGERNLHYYLATAHSELDHFEETERHIRACLETEPDNPELLNFLGYLYAEENVKIDEAHELLDRALAADPENPYYLDSLGWIYYRKGDAEKAIDYIQRAIYGMESDDAILRDHLGDAYLLKGDTARAVAEWERALRLDKKIEGVQEKILKHKSGT